MSKWKDFAKKNDDLIFIFMRMNSFALVWLYKKIYEIIWKYIMLDKGNILPLHNPHVCSISYYYTSIQTHRQKPICLPTDQRIHHSLKGHTCYAEDSSARRVRTTTSSPFTTESHLITQKPALTMIYWLNRPITIYLHCTKVWTGGFLGQ